MFDLPKHWIVLVLYIFILILFYFFVPWTLVGRSLLKEASRAEKQHPAALLPHLRISGLAIKDDTDTHVDSVALERHLTVDAPKKNYY